MQVLHHPIQQPNPQLLHLEHIANFHLTNNSNYEHPIQVFQKANVNQWLDKGAFKLSNITEESNEIKIKLVLVTKKRESI